MCSTISHTHEHFVGIKQCLKRHKQLVQTTTILDLSVKLTCLVYCSTSTTRSHLYQLTRTTTTAFLTPLLPGKA